MSVRTPAVLFPIALAAALGGIWLSPPGPLLLLVASSIAVGAAIGSRFGLDIRVPTLPGVWFLTFQAMLVLPVVVRYSYLGPMRDRLALGLTLTQVATGAALWTSCSLLGYSRATAVEYVRRPLVGHVLPIGLRRLAVLAFAATSLTVFGYLIEVPAVPLLQLTTADATSLAYLREEAFKLLDSRFLYLYAVTRSYGLPFLVMVSLGLWWVSRERRTLAFTAIVLAQALFFAAASIARLPVAQVVLLIVLFCYLASGGNHWRRLAVGGVAVLSFPVLVVMAISDVGLGRGIYAVVRRLLVAPTDVLYWYFALFPDVHDHVGGLSIGKYAWVLGVDTFDVPNYVALEGLNTRIQTANANAAYPGSLYADFGTLGLLVGGVAVGVLLALAQVTLSRGRKDPVNLAAYCFSLYCVWLLQSTSALVVLATNGWLLALASPVVFQGVSAFLQGAGPDEDT